jgi:hypothetical protein
MKYAWLFLLVVLGPACQRDEPAEEPAPDPWTSSSATAHLQVLLDPNLRLDPTAQARWLEGVQQDLQALGAEGDRVQVCILAGGSRARCLFKAESRVSRDLIASQGVDDGDARYREALGGFRNTCYQQLKRVLAEAQVATPARESDLWSALEQMSDFLVQARPGDRKRVHLLTEGREYTTGPGRRNLAAQPPTSEAEARAFAQTDAEWIRANLAVNPQALANTTVVIRPLSHPLL